MKTLRFEGHSDDTFGEVDVFQDDHDNCANGKPIPYLVRDTATGEGLIITGRYADGDNCGWSIGVGNYDPAGDDVAMPNWPMRIEPQKPFSPGRTSYQPSLLIEVPDTVVIKYLNPNGDSDAED